MDLAPVEALVQRWNTLRTSGESPTRFIEHLKPVWAEADRAFAQADASERAAPQMALWLCRWLWEAVQRESAQLSAHGVGLLARCGLWGIEEATFAIWSGTLARRFEVFDDRYLESALLSMSSFLADEQLPAFVDALEAHRQDLDSGALARELVQRLIASHQREAARRAFRLPKSASYHTLALEELLPILSAEERELEIQAAWKAAEEDMQRGDQFAAYRCTEWARLISFSAPGHRPERIRFLEALISRLPTTLLNTSQDNPDLRLTMAQVLADDGQVERALEWVHRMPDEELEWCLGDLVEHLPVEHQEPVAREALEHFLPVYRDRTPRILVDLAATSPALLRSCLEAISKFDEEERIPARLVLLPVMSSEDADALLAEFLSSELSANERERGYALDELVARKKRGQPTPSGQESFLQQALARAAVDDLAPIAQLLPESKLEDFWSVLNRLEPVAREEKQGEELLIAVARWLERAPHLFETRREEVVALLLRFERDLPAATELLALIPTEQLRTLAQSRLATERKKAPTRVLRGQLINQFCSDRALEMPGREASLVQLATPSLAERSKVIANATSWGRAALWALTEKHWAGFATQVLLVDQLPSGLTEAILIRACRLASAEEFTSWLTEHPPKDIRLVFNSLEPEELDAFGKAMKAMAVTPEWAEDLRAPPSPPARETEQALNSWFETAPANREYPPPHWEIEDRLRVLFPHLDANQLRRAQARLETLFPQLRDEFLWPLVRRWIELGDAERAEHTSRLVRFNSYQHGSLLDVGVAFKRGALVDEALRGMVADGYDPTISLLPGAERAALAGFLDEVLAIAREQKQPSLRAAMLAALGSHVNQTELAAAIDALIETGEPIQHCAFGRAALLLEPKARARMWAHAFSSRYANWPLPFRWDTPGPLEIALSLPGAPGQHELIEQALRIDR
jgi:hypothetical protein